jgi:16S rRNA A1518/A1519 N6-dimethyltransferase RsmA/KsgA/DIM1 with predicted DNA glycosylase/AP lyase activity
MGIFQKNHVAATEEQVKYNKGDEQFDVGPGIGNLRHALSRLRAPIY